MPDATVYALMVGDGLVADLIDPICAAGYRISGSTDPRFYILQRAATPTGTDGHTERAAA
ncbi:hypothetical protein [Jeongeupia sp. USM3]|uniref:hypothetical protein n=1 Tax=Jeongeupia sp. USM3 TaxID=1906741 RepID=UPI00089DFA13|nr:hypothetical protein [Jeongeupia sp. USM3]AOY00125.1 hypothetical protein BJP62_06465 [Jeongeupia sp. USM3]